MSFAKKTKAQLIDEVEALRRRIVEMEKCEAGRKRTEEELKKAKEYAQNIIESSLNMIVSVDKDRRIVQFNKAASDVFGYTEEEILGKHVHILYADEEEGHRVHSLITENGVFIGEIQNVRKNGEVFTSLLSATLLHDRNGEVIGAVGNSRDITEHKRMEEEVRRVSEYYQNLVGTAGDAIISTDRELKVTVWNTGAERVYGYSREEALGQPASVLIGGRDKCDEISEIQRDVLDGKLMGPFEAVRYRKDGTPVWVSITPTALRDKEDEIVEVLGVQKDITERKKLEQEVRETKELLENLIAAAGDTIIMADKEGVVTVWNPAAERLYGYTEEEAVGSSIFSLHIPSWKRGEADKLREEWLRQGGGVQGYETQRMRKDGLLLWVSISNAPVVDREGRYIGVISIHKDITEHKRADEEIIKAKEFLENLVGEAGDGIVSFDLQQQIGTWNTGMETIYGFTKDEALGRHVGELLGGADRQGEPGAFIDEILATGQIRRWETERYKKDGSKVPVMITGSPIRDIGGRIIGVSGFHKDITERKRAEEERGRISEYYQNLVGSAGDAIVAVDPELKVTVWNDGAERIFGYAREEALGQPIVSLVGRVDKADEMMKISERAYAGRQVGPLEVERYRKDGTTVWVSLSLAPLEGSDGRIIGTSAIYKDVTQRKEVEERLVAYQEQLRRLVSELSLAEERERRRIATNLHDHAGQKLAVCRMKLDMLRGMEPLSTVAEGLDEAAELLREVIRETRHLTFELSPPILYEVGLEETLRWLAEHHQEVHGVVCEFGTDTQPKPLGEDVSVALFQAVRELLLNVAKHADARRVKLSIQRDADDIRIDVEDYGVGFDVSQAAWQGIRTEAFGLFNIRERIDHLGGRIEIASERGRGTCATLVMPLKSEGE